MKDNYDILIVEDDNDTNNLINEALTKEGYNCVQAFSGTEGMLYINNNEFKLIILDLMLPGLSGEEVLKKIRNNKDISVIILSAKDSLDEKIQLLELGAEDYITKPFEVLELIARVKVQLRKKIKIEDKITKYKDLALNNDGYTLSVNDEKITLTRVEYKIMELLISSPKQVFSKQAIFDYAWEEEYIGEDKTVNVHISNIRKKIAKVSDEEYIETVWGLGFKMAN